MRVHRAGKGAKYLRGKSFELVYSEAHPTWSLALKHEAEIKRWPAAKKRALIQNAAKKRAQTNPN